MRHLWKSLIRFLLIYLILTGLSSESPAAGRLRTSGGSWNIPLKAQHVEATVIDGLARTTVRQVFVSNRHRAMEAIYEFPVPEGAALVDVAMEVGGRRYEGLLLDRDRARRIYDRLVRRRIDPALVEELDENIFRLSVFPVLPWKRTIVELTWVEALPRIDGVLRYTYPLAMAGEEDCWTDADLTVSVEFQSSERILAVTSPTPDVKTAMHGWRKARARLKRRDARLDRDIVVEARMSNPEGPELSFSTWRSETGERWFMAGISAPRFKPGDVPPMELTFVVDRSASMRGSKLEAAVEFVTALTERGHAGSGLNVLSFGEQVERLADHVLTGPEARARVAEHAGGLVADGHTDFGGALAAIANLPPPAEGVFAATLLLTDGVPNRGEREADHLVKLARETSLKRHRLFVVPLGKDADSEFLERIAAASGGTMLHYPLPVRQGGSGHQAALARIEAQLVPPVLTDITIGADGVEVTDVHPQPSNDLFGGRQVILTGRYTGEGPASVTLSGQSAGRTITWFTEQNFPAEPGGTPFIPFLHARRKVDDLAAVRPRTGAIEKEIIATALSAGIVSPLTSFLVLLPEDRRRLTNAADDLAMRKAVRSAWEQRHRSVAAGAGESTDLVVLDSTLKPKTPAGAAPPGGLMTAGGSAGGRSGRSWGPVRRILPKFMEGRSAAFPLDEEELRVYSEAAHRGLRWLGRHQESDGSFDPDDFTDRCGASLCSGPGRPGATVLVTALAALAWLGDAPATLWYRDTAHRALDWLAREQQQSGAIGTPGRKGFLIGHATATLAFAEMFAFSGDSVWEHRAERALTFLARCEGKTFRRKIGIEPDAGTFSPDTWATLAAITGHATKLKFPRTLPTLQKRLPAESAFLTLVLLGKNPAKNEEMQKQAGIARDLIQSGKAPADRIIFACLALRQMGGDGWKECMKKVLDPLLEAQSEEGDEAGSFAPTGVWGKPGGRIGSTALAVMILQSHKRYRRIHAPRRRSRCSNHPG